ncbi:hypothetical protein K440DRAFT_665409 [Wilcoxina mikolae CBS 423.85]|nr:hypothetical protein K440DRAFT_665409 [Wilcoxina mikolae CBS 423.85]
MDDVVELPDCQQILNNFNGPENEDTEEGSNNTRTDSIDGNDLELGDDDVLRNSANGNEFDHDDSGFQDDLPPSLPTDQDYIAAYKDITFAVQSRPMFMIPETHSFTLRTPSQTEDLTNLSLDQMWGRIQDRQLRTPDSRQREIVLMTAVMEKITQQNKETMPNGAAGRKKWIYAKICLAFVARYGRTAPAFLDMVLSSVATAPNSQLRRPSGPFPAFGEDPEAKDIYAFEYLRVPTEEEAPGHYLIYQICQLFEPILDEKLMVKPEMKEQLDTALKQARQMAGQAKGCQGIADRVPPAKTIDFFACKCPLHTLQRPQGPFQGRRARFPFNFRDLREVLSSNSASM